MKNRIGVLILGLCITVMGSAVIASESKGTSGVKFENYKYGMKLDIKKVISSNVNPSHGCEVVPAQMMYEDSQGNIKGLNYKVIGDNCSFN